MVTLQTKTGSIRPVRGTRIFRGGQNHRTSPVRTFPDSDRMSHLCGEGLLPGEEPCDKVSGPRRPRRTGVDTGSSPCPIVIACPPRKNRSLVPSVRPRPLWIEDSSLDGTKVSPRLRIRLTAFRTVEPTQRRPRALLQPANVGRHRVTFVSRISMDKSLPI